MFAHRKTGKRAKAPLPGHHQLSSMTQPPASPPSSSSPHHVSSALAAASDALVALVDAGVSLHDTRLETLLTLIHRSRQALAVAAPPPSLPPALPPQNPPANPHYVAPTTITPITARNSPPRPRSLQFANQAAITASRLAYELTPSSASHHALQPPTASFSSPLTPSPQTPSPPTASLSPHPSRSSPTSTREPNTIFQVARSIVPEIRRQRRNDPKSPRRAAQRRRPPSATPPDNLPFSAQHFGDLSAEHVFQMKAQVHAFRRLARGAPLPPELLVAARGKPPTTVHTHAAPVVTRGNPDLMLGPSLERAPVVEPHTFEFNPCHLSRFPPNHEFTKDDVLQPAETDVSDEEVERRILLAQTHHDRLHARALRESLTVIERQQNVAPMQADFDLDPVARQQHDAVIKHLNADVLQQRSSVPAELPLHPYRFSNDRKSQRRRDRNTQTVEVSVVHERLATPITVASTPHFVPDYATLLAERRNRVTTRLLARATEIADMRDGVTAEVRHALDTEHRWIRMLNLQRSVRVNIMACMRRVVDRQGLADLRLSKISKMRRHMPPIQHGAQSHYGAQKMEDGYRKQQRTQRETRKQNTNLALINHTNEMRSFYSSRIALKKRLLKELDKYFREKSREEERRKKKEQLDRLRALRNNNEDEYLELLKTTKNQRLIQLLKQTDEYLMQIGAQVERQKQTAREEDEIAASGAGASGEHDSKNSAANGDGPGTPSDDDDLNQLKKRRNDYYTITHTISEKVHQPSSLVGGKLKHYQLEGLEWLVSLYNNNLNGILADEMGLGKTIQTISLISYLVEVKHVTGPFLVIVPLSVMSNWVRELELWAPSLVKVVYKGDPNARKSIQHSEMYGNNYNVLLTTYEFVVKDKNVLGRIKWKYIIMDEGHRMKNADCKLALTLGAKYSSRNRLLLTGTPLQNNMTELWALLNFLLPTIFSSADTFETWFNAPFQESTLGDSADLNVEENLLIISRLHQVLRPFMLRRLKTDVEAQLPDKVEIVFRCEMSTWQRVLYRQMRAKLGIAGGAGNVGTRSFNNMVMQLKKVCNHPYLFYNEEELTSLPPEFLMRASGKFELLDHVLKKLKKGGHRVLLFSQMTAALDYLEYFLSSIDMKHLRLDGTTKADDRQQMLEMFNAPNSEYFCFLLSTRAGGLGLNLQTADTVIIFDSDWNPMMDLQAQDRAHRIGQTKEVRVFRLICSGSIEVKILERANRKLQIESQVIQAGQFNNKSSDNDRQEMLKYLIRQQVEDDANSNLDVTGLEEINQSLARGEGEIEMFQKLDEELKEASGGISRLMSDEKDVPDWVLKPEQEEEPKEQKEAKYIKEHGRGRRKRKEVVYDDNLTEKEWTIAMEEEGDIAEAVKRKRRRRSVGNGVLDRTDKGGTPSDVGKDKDGSIPKECDEELHDSATNGATSKPSANGKPERRGTRGKKAETIAEADASHVQKPRRKRGRPRKNAVRSAS